MSTMSVARTLLWIYLLTFGFLLTFWVLEHTLTRFDGRYPLPALHSLRSFASERTTGKLYGDEYRGRSSPTDINRVTNATLGFSDVFVVSLPGRTDKRDAITLTSALTGFRVEYVDGVRGEDISDKAVPFGVNRKMLWETNLGSWRGHMNAVRRIVQEGLASALIMEDDMDWDVRLKAQLELIAQGSRTLLPSSDPYSSDPNSPYGDQWDVLWLGHCGEVFPEMLPENQDLPANHPARQQFVIQDDPTVPPPAHVTGLVDFAAHPNTRWLHVSGGPICSFAYALSQRGARKVLFDLSVDHLTGPFDNALAGMCRSGINAWDQKEQEEDGDNGLDAKCLSVTPPLFFHHKPKGRVDGDSDIQAAGEDGSALRDKGCSENIVWSARSNVMNMISGAVTMESQFN